MKHKFILSLALLSSSVFAEERVFPSAQFVKEVKIKSLNGEVHVQSSASPDIKINYTKKNPAEFDAHCMLVLDQNAKRDKVHVEVKTLQAHNGNACNIRFDVTMPENRNIDVSLDNGEIHAKGHFVEVDADLSNGSIFVNQVRGRAKLKADNGDIDLTMTEAHKIDARLINGNIKVHCEQILERSDIDLKSTNGNVGLTARKTPVYGKVDVSNTNGNIDISFGSTAIFDLKQKVALGKVTNAFTVSPTSKFRVEVSSSLGQIQIKKMN